MCETCLIVSVKSRKVVYTIGRSTFAHNKQNSDSVLRCFVRARIALHKMKGLASTNNDLWITRLFVAMRRCVCGEHMRHICRCSYFSWFANTLCSQWSERHLHSAQSKPINAYKHLWSKMVLPLQDLFATVYETAARIKIRESCKTIAITS